MNVNEIRSEIDKYLSQNFKCLLNEKDTLKNLQKGYNTHGESINKLKARISDLESTVATLKNSSTNTVQPNNLLTYLESIDDSLKFIKSNMSIEIYEPYNTYYKSSRQHINPFFKEE